MQSESLPDVGPDQPLEELLFQDPYAPDEEDPETAIEDCDVTEEADFGQLSVKQLKALARAGGSVGILECVSGT